MPQNRPTYEALDQRGRPFTRPARIVAELPTPAARLAACDEATGAIAQLLGRTAQRRIAFGMPVFAAFMTAPEAKKHPQKALLETRGCVVSMDLCTTYN
jgi:hypothetical protein